jgi:hypothetical protein
LKCLHTLYAYPGPANWKEIALANAGLQPVIFEFANGGNLAGDEAGLKFHFATLVGILENGNLLFCDGDNLRRDAAHVLCEYTQSMVLGAQPCGLIVVKYPQKDATGYVEEDDGSITYNKSGIHLIGAVASFVVSHAITAECLASETYYQGSDWSVTPFTNGVVLVWDNVDKSLVLNHAGEVIAALLKDKS